MILCYRSIPAIVIATAMLLSVVQPAHACGPFFTDAIFVYSKHPDFPLERFAEGTLGVLQPTYARSYLFVAYRTLTGVGLSASEATALKSLWDDRLSSGGELDDSALIKKWTDARSKVPGLSASPEIRAFRRREKPHEYESYLNCQEDAFDNAAATLADRIKRFGADSPLVHDWVSAQDAVFANCYEGKHIPEPISPSAETIAVADRAYQIGAANFYAENFDEAKAAFDDIARDRRSMFREKAPYLAARALIRKASLSDKEEEGRPWLAEAETRLNAILKDKSLSSSHHAAARLLNLDRVRLHPEEKIHELARSIARKDISPDFKQDVWDYTVLLDKFVGDDDEPKKVIPAGIKSDELTDWILTLQDTSAEAVGHSFERWEKTRSLAWLTVSLIKADPQYPGLDQLLDAAQRIDENSPAFPTVTFNNVRLLIESGRNEPARKALAGMLGKDRSLLPKSAVNRFLSQQMMLAQNLDEFVKAAQRIPAGFSDDADGRELPEDEKEANETTKGAQFFFDADAASIINQAMPVAVLTEAALSKAPAANLRRDLARAAFMRAALLDAHERASEMIDVLGSYYPEMKGALAAYQRANTADARRYATIYIALKFPGMRPYVAVGIGRTTALAEIDSFRDNWWCAEPPAPPSDWSGEEQTEKKPKPISPPEFLIRSQAVAKGEIGALQALGTGPNYFAQTAIDWARKNPADPHAPEALHLAVRSTRYGCTDKETGRWSKAAFDLLHARYPNTSWARATKYWFKD